MAQVRQFALVVLIAVFAFTIKVAINMYQAAPVPSTGRPITFKRDYAVDVNKLSTQALISTISLSNPDDSLESFLHDSALSTVTKKGQVTQHVKSKLYRFLMYYLGGPARKLAVLSI